jgi:hypothetical protein
MGKRFSLLYRVQIGSEAHPASNIMVTGDYFSGVKRPRRQADYSSSSTAEVKNVGAVPPLLHIFIAWCLIN